MFDQGQIGDWDDTRDTQESDGSGGSGLLAADNHYIQGTPTSDLIRWTQNVVFVDAGGGVDVVVIDGSAADARFETDGFGRPVLSMPGAPAPVTLANVEQIAFNDEIRSVTDILVGESAGDVAAQGIERTDPNTDTPTMASSGQPAISSEKHFVLGTGNNDLIQWTPNVIYVEAGGGVDTVIVDGLRESAQVKFESAGKTVMTLVGVATSITMANVERIAFDDGVLHVDMEGNTGQAFRLYQASFDRPPDDAGLQFWVDKLDNGELSLLEIADQFLNSPEFTRTYGAQDGMSDRAYLELLYVNVLNRKPDPSGYAYWSEQQLNELTREEMLVHFSESDENKEQVAAAISDGIWMA